MSALLEVENLSYHYGERKALDGLSFSVERGEIFGFLGPNGGGKTTTFKILSTLFSTEPGQVKLFGLDLAKDRLKIREKMGVVFQLPALDKKLSVRENLWHQGHLYGLMGRELSSRISRDLGRVGLLNRAKDKVEPLSGGASRPHDSPPRSGKPSAGSTSCSSMPASPSWRRWRRGMRRAGTAPSTSI